MKFLTLLTWVIKSFAAVRARILVLVAGSLASTSLIASELRWEKLPLIPNALGVAGAFAGVSGDALLVAGGANFPGKKPWEGGSKVWHREVFVLEKPDGEWLRDAWRYTPGKGWKRLADLPHVAMAAPSPAPVVNGRLLVIGGDDGAQVNALPDQHKGFRHDVLAYDPEFDRWESMGDAPFAHVATTAVMWKQRIVIPSGEVKPGIRSPEVWSARTR